MADVTQTAEWKVDEGNVVRPLTLRQVLNATRKHEHDLFKLDGRKFYKVIIVATIREEIVVEDNRWVTYRLDDGTTDRPVTAKFSKGYSEDEYQRLLPSRPGMTPRLADVRIMGRLGEQYGRNFIWADTLRASPDPHEMYHHLLNVMTTQLFYERGPPNKPPPRKPQEEDKDKDGDNEEPHEDDEEAARELHPPDAVPRVPKPPQSPRQSRFDSPLPKLYPRTPRKPGDVPRSAAASSSTSSPLRRSNNTETDTPPRRVDHTADTLNDPEPVPVPDTPAAPPLRRSPRNKKTADATDPPSKLKVQRERRRLSTRDPLSHLSSLQRAILLMVMEEPTSSSKGVYVGDIARSVKGNSDGPVTSQAISDALDFLVDEGHLVATDEDNHFYKAQDKSRKKKEYPLPTE
ncbi:hypothetical protein BDW22DRAFT_1426860 [Trametopsis cervina]|nr:hypothetical protein BDW22DRAFT_1426860 [Trametopsis cervina]